MTRRDDYIQAMKTQLDELNAKMDAVAAKAHETQDQARAKYQQQVAKLRQQSRTTAAKLEDLKAAGEDRWEALVTEMDKLRDAFTHSFHYFKSRV